MLLPKFPYRDDGLRVIATFLALSLILSTPTPAFALRELQPANNAGLEEDLAKTLGRSDTGITAGLEERVSPQALNEILFRFRQTPLTDKTTWQDLYNVLALPDDAFERPKQVRRISTRSVGQRTNEAPLHEQLSFDRLSHWLRGKVVRDRSEAISPQPLSRLKLFFDRGHDVVRNIQSLAGKVSFSETALMSIVELNIIDRSPEQPLDADLVALVRRTVELMGFTTPLPLEEWSGWVDPNRWEFIASWLESTVDSDLIRVDSSVEAVLPYLDDTAEALYHNGSKTEWSRDPEFSIRNIRRLIRAHGYRSKIIPRQDLLTFIRSLRYLAVATRQIWEETGDLKRFEIRGRLAEISDDVPWDYYSDTIILEFLRVLGVPEDRLDLPETGAGLEEGPVAAIRDALKEAGLRGTVSEAQATNLLSKENLTPQDVIDTLRGVMPRGRAGEKIAREAVPRLQAIQKARKEKRKEWGTVNWAKKEVLPTLSRLASSGLDDFQSLRKAGETLSAQDKDSWLKAVGELEVHASQWRQSMPFPKDVFMHLVQWLDDHWLAHRKVLVFPELRAEPVSGPEDLASRLLVGRIEQRRDYTLLGRPIPVYLVVSERAMTVEMGMGQVAWVPSGMIIVPLDNLARDAKVPWVTDLNSLPDPIKASKLFQALDATLRDLRSRYQNPKAYLEFLRGSAPLEELRHALDHFHIEADSGKNVFAMSAQEQQNLFLYLLLPEGVLRQIWDKPGAIMGVADPNIAKDLYFFALRELSGQMTKAAVGQYPLDTVSDWTSIIFQAVITGRVEFRSAAYYLAAQLALHLLGEELEVIPAPTSLADRLKMDPDQAASVTLHLLTLPPERIRLALKAVYERNFIYPIDEPPFSEITPEGHLRPHSAGLEETPVADSYPSEVQEVFLVALLRANRNLWFPIVEHLRATPPTIDVLMNDPSQAPQLLGKGWKKNKQKLMIRHLNSAKREAVRTAEEFKRRVEEESKIPPEQKAARWITEKVVPALELVATKGLADFKPLRQIGEGEIPLMELKSWFTFMDQVEEAFKNRRTPGTPLDFDTAMDLIAYFNNNALVPHDLLIIPAILSMDPSLPGDRSKFFKSLIPVKIREKRVYSLNGKTIPAYFIEEISPQSQWNMRAAWLPLGRAILISRNSFAGTDQGLWSASKIRQQLSNPIARMDPAYPAKLELVDLWETLAQRYNPDSYLQVSMEEAVYEEIRHALDHVHVEESLPNKRFLIQDDEFFIRFVETQISEEGSLRQIFDNPLPGFDIQPSQLALAKQNLAHAFIEVSGMMTSMAVGSEPAVTIETMFASPIRRPKVFDAHNVAVGLITALLAKEFDLTQTPLTPERWVQISPDEIGSWLSQIAQKPPEQIRLAIKAVYQREFIHPVDESPFPEIRADGTLAPRDTAGLEERMPAWLQELVTPEELEQWIYRGHKAMVKPQPVAVLFEPGLLPGVDDLDRQVLLVGLEEQVKAAFTWPEHPPFRLGLLSEKAGLEESGFRVIPVLRHPEAGVGALPESALPVVALQALASPQGRFYVDPVFYAGLEEITLPDALATLTDLFA